LTKEFSAKEKLEIVLSAPVPANQSGRRGVWGNSAARAQQVPFEYFQTDTAAKQFARQRNMLM
jgi:hypothetical protein